MSRRTISQITNKCLEILLLVYNLHILASVQKTFLFFRATFEQVSLQNATFDCFLSNFLRNYRKLLKNLKQHVESPNSVTGRTGETRETKEHGNKRNWVNRGTGETRGKGGTGGTGEQGKQGETGKQG